MKKCLHVELTSPQVVTDVALVFRRKQVVTTDCDEIALSCAAPAPADFLVALHSVRSETVDVVVVARSMLVLSAVVDVHVECSFHQPIMSALFIRASRGGRARIRA